MNFSVHESGLSQRGSAYSPTERAITFGSFFLLPKRRLLFEEANPVHLGSRAFDILLTLIERPGELVGKEEIMARVWPNTFVVPANLSVHICALRRVLGGGRRGNRYLVSIPGRGYRFVAPVFLTNESIPAPTQPVATHGVHNQPVEVTKLHDRGEAERIASGLAGATRLMPTSGAIEIEFATGARMRITGEIDASTISILVTALTMARWR